MNSVTRSPGDLRRNYDDTTLPLIVTLFAPKQCDHLMIERACILCLA